ncbi:MAG: hypothetical protein RIK87_27475 [Fuerstiella sp.]
MIVIALLGLLAFTGVVFYTFSSQERAAADYFSEAAKANQQTPDGVWPHMLEQILAGPSERHRGSILYSPNRRFSLLRNLYGNDVYPHNGEGLEVDYDRGTGQPVLTTFSGTDLLDFVDSPAARGGVTDRVSPEPDVDYTYPDINNLFLAYKGWAIREDVGGGLTQVPVIIPSFFRPQYMRQAASSAPGALSAGFQRSFGTVNADVLTNPHWAYAYQPATGTGTAAVPVAPDRTNRDSVLFGRRSFRPHPSHLAGIGPSGLPVRRYLTDDEAAAPGIGLAAGGFPFLPEEGGASQPGSGNGIRGDLGIWTGSPDLAYELDADNDGDGIREGIWLDLNFPIQEFQEPGGTVRTYAVLHSVTIYDADGLFNLNVHGNLAGLPKTGTSSGTSFQYTVAQATADGYLSDNFLSRSHHGLGPHEINPIWGLRREPVLSGPFERSLSDRTLAHMYHHFGVWPTNSLQQGNMEWLWLLTGRGDYRNHGVVRQPSTGNVTSVNVSDFDRLISGRWGDEQMLYHALEKAGQRMLVVDLPRPGRAGPFYQAASGVSFGGRGGFDDNQNWREGEGLQTGGVLQRRPFGHPVSFSGHGRRTHVDTPVFNPAVDRFDFAAGNNYFGTDSPLSPLLLRLPGSTGIDRFPGYRHYGASSVAVAGTRYTYGPDQTFTGQHHRFNGTGGDDLNHAPVFDELFEDPLETIFDQDLADRGSDTLFPVADTAALQWPSSTRAKIQLRDSQDRISRHALEAAPHALDVAADNREMFTTLSHSLRQFPLRRSAQRPWEFSADTDGADRNNDGFADGDGLPEFPPAFGTTSSTGRPFSRTDPFRPPVRRLLTNEVGEQRDMVGSLPLSLNHILDVDRTETTPPEGSAAYLRYMQKTGMRFRPLTEHPLGTDASASGQTVLNTTRVPSLELRSDADSNTSSAVAGIPFPPRSIGDQEFWARRDRQQLARDIYVLLYTLGGAEQVGGVVRDYTGFNDPDAAPGTALYSHDQLRRMAQLAVNLVDAMDTDSVITKFEYDKNLGDGWNLDDDAFTAESLPLPEGAPGTAARQQFERTTADGMYREDSKTRGVVYGVEQQAVAFNEVLAVRCEETTVADHKVTLHDDLNHIRDHLFVELKNLIPRATDLATSRSLTAESGIYRLARFDRPDQFAPLASTASPVAAVTFLPGAGQIPAGGLFTIACASDSLVTSSDLFLDWDLDGTYNLIAPRIPAGTLPTRATALQNAFAPELKPRCSLDLIHPDHAADRFVVTDEAQQVTGFAGAFLDQLRMYYGTQPMHELSTHAPGAGGDFRAKWSEVGFDLVLQRRLNPNIPMLSNSSGQALEMNPWVETDRVRVEFDRFDLQETDTPAEFTGTNGRLARLRSFERKEPLDDSTRQLYALPITMSDYVFNSIGTEYNTACLRDPTKPRNESPSDPDFNPLQLATVWQPHFDRDLTSPAELLQLPVFGPRLLTQRLRFSQLAPAQQTIPAAIHHQVSGAEALFLRPEFDPESSGATHLNNRWYRLFSFVEVPSRLHRMLGSYLQQTRVPGRLNLNMIRHLEVLAGLIDDPMFAEPDADRLRSPFLRGQTPGSAFRDRWLEFVRERDGGVVDGYFDPTPALPGSGDESTRFLIPGTPRSRPFRSFSYTRNDPDDNGFDHTILRRLMEDRDEDGDGDDDELQVGLAADDDDGDLLPDDNPGGGNAQNNRQWLEPGASVRHTNPSPATSPVERHQVLSKVLNNTTTVSNVFVVFATAAWFEAYEDPASGLYRIGGRIDLDGSDGRNPGWQQRAVFVIDRTEAVKAQGRGQGDLDWKRLIRYQADIE